MRAGLLISYPGMNGIFNSPFRDFLAGQHTNSTPLKTSMPHGRSMAKERSFMPRSPQARPAVEFHWSKFQHFVWL